MADEKKEKDPSGKDLKNSIKDEIAASARVVRPDEIKKEIKMVKRSHLLKIISNME